MPKKEKLPLLTKQSFAGAGGRELFGKLKMRGFIRVLNKDHEPTWPAYDALVERAKELNANYIFDIKEMYCSKFEEGKEIKYIDLIEGTIYRKNGLLKRLYNSFSW
jgi:hypothetical protein